MSEPDWTHDDLAADLTRTRWEAGEIAAQEVSLGPGGSGGAADVVAVRPSWRTAYPAVYEVKVSRADFLGDVRSEKWRRYLPWCDRLFFAVPDGLVGKDEIPKGCGLWVRSDNGWSCKKVSRLHHIENGDERTKPTAMAVLLALQPSPWDSPHPDRLERIRHLAEKRDLSKALGERLAEKIRGYKYLQEVQDRTLQAKQVLGDAMDIPAREIGQTTIDKLAEMVVERYRAEGVLPVFNQTCEVVQEAMPLHHAFDPMSLAAHVGEIIRERDRLRKQVRELESEDAA